VIISLPVTFLWDCTFNHGAFLVVIKNTVLACKYAEMWGKKELEPHNEHGHNCVDERL
jgi:hypothetical protein